MASVEHFEIPVDNLERAQGFYNKLFGWQFKTENFGGFEYTFIQTKENEQETGIHGGMMKRQCPEQKTLAYIGVDSIDETLKQIQESGGKVLLSKSEVEGAGFMAVCLDTENNSFGLWENARK